MLSTLIKSRDSGGQYSIGVDLGATALKIAVLEPRAKLTPKLVGAYIIPYPKVNLENVAIIDKFAYQSPSLKAFQEFALSTLPSSRRNFVVCLPAHDVIVKSFFLDGGDESRFKAAIRSKIEAWMPGISDDLVVDFETFSQEADRSRAGIKRDILCAITRAQHVEQLKDLCRSSAIIPRIIDTEWSALINVISCCYPESFQELKIILDLGASGCKVLVVRGAQPLVSRRIDMALARGAEPDTDNIDKAGPTVVDALNPHHHKYLSPDKFNDQPPDLMLHDLIPKIKEALTDLPLTDLPLTDGCQVYLTGGLSGSGALVKELSGIFQRPVIQINPYRMLHLNEAGEASGSHAIGTLSGGRFAVAIGLAIRALPVAKLNSGSCGGSLKLVRPSLVRFNLSYDEDLRFVKSPFKRLFRDRGAVGILYLACIFIAVLGSGYFSNLKMDRSLVNEIAAINRRIEEAQLKVSLVNSDGETQNPGGELAASLKKLKENGGAILELLSEVSRKIPQFAWLNRLHLKGGSILISGRAIDPMTVASFAQALGSSHLTSGLEIKGVKQIEQNGVYLQDFLLEASLR